MFKNPKKKEKRRKTENEFPQPIEEKIEVLRTKIHAAKNKKNLALLRIYDQVVDNLLTMPEPIETQLPLVNETGYLRNKITILYDRVKRITEEVDIRKATTIHIVDDLINIEETLKNIITILPIVEQTRHNLDSANDLISSFSDLEVQLNYIEIENEIIKNSQRQTLEILRVTKKNISYKSVFIILETIFNKIQNSVDPNELSNQKKEEVIHLLKNGIQCIKNDNHLSALKTRLLNKIKDILSFVMNLNIEVSDTSGRCKDQIYLSLQIDQSLARFKEELESLQKLDTENLDKLESDNFPDFKLKGNEEPTVSADFIKDCKTDIESNDGETETINIDEPSEKRHKLRSDIISVGSFKSIVNNSDKMGKKEGEYMKEFEEIGRMFNDEIKPQIKMFVGTRADSKYFELDEYCTRLVLRLDRIQFERGSQKHRKKVNLLKEIYRFGDILNRKADQEV